MATDSMIERVARALCSAHGFSPDSAACADGKVVWAWESFVSDARIAIEAMREPTPMMSAAGIVAEADNRIMAQVERPEKWSFPPLVFVWRRMIDAALKSD